MSRPINTTDLIQRSNYSWHLLRDDTPRIDPVFILKLVPLISVRLGDGRHHAIQMAPDDFAVLDDRISELDSSAETKCTFDSGEQWRLSRAGSNAFEFHKVLSPGSGTLSVEIADARQFLADMTEAKLKGFEIFDGKSDLSEAI